MAATIPPDTRAAGQTGHIADHNNISDVLSVVAAQLGAIPVFYWGTAPLSGGSVTIPNGNVTASSVILLSRQGLASGTPGSLAVSAVVPGVSFTITSTSVTENSTLGYLIINSPPAIIP